MVDQELDALLVGALYGELGPADEARLAAHLESHPTDRTALDDLRSTRKALLDARFFELWFDPPPAVSALLVQEAARRAPRVVAREGDGWFMRFVRSFAAHPAMAAAAMFVVVLGVAGTLYMSKGAELAQSKPAMDVATTTTATAPPAADVPAAAPISQVAQPATGADNGMVADLEDGKDERRLAKAKAPEVQQAPSRTKGIIVAQHEAMPKDLDKNDDATLSGDYKQGVAESAAAPPPGAPATAPASVVATVGAAGGGAAANQKEQRDQQQDSWARDQHARVASLVQGGRCVDAAPLAAEIKSRAPDYYSAYVATDRSIKACLPYIARAVEKQDADRAKAAKAAAKIEPADSTK
jgi:hypothetical protein